MKVKENLTNSIKIMLLTSVSNKILVIEELKALCDCWFLIPTIVNCQWFVFSLWIVSYMGGVIKAKWKRNVVLRDTKAMLSFFFTLIFLDYLLHLLSMLYFTLWILQNNKKLYESIFNMLHLGHNFFLKPYNILTYTGQCFDSIFTL